MGVQNGVIKTYDGLANYIFAKDEYSYKEDEIKGFLFSHDLTEKEYKQRFESLKERNGNKSTRLGRSLIIPIPWDLKEPEKQKQFTSDYMKNLGKRLNMDLFYIGAIHNTIEDGVINNHAHIMLSERELLAKPEIKNIKTRYYDKNNKLCRKDDPNMDHCIKAHKEEKYFSKANRIFNLKDFNKIIDNVRVNTILQSKDLSDKAKYTLTCPSIKSEKQAHEKKFYSKRDIQKIQRDLKDPNITYKSWKEEVRYYNKESSHKKRLRIHDNISFGCVPSHLQEIKDLEEIKAELREKYPDAREETIEKMAIKQLEERQQEINNEGPELEL